MNLELIEDERVKEKLTFLSQQDHILGFLLQGSRVTGFGNSKSDYDIIIYCTNEFFKSLTYDTLIDNIVEEVEGQKRMVGDFAFMCDDVFEQQKSSPMDIDHIAYSESIILLDKTGLLENWVNELAKVDDEYFNTRLKMQFVQLAIAFGYLNVNHKRERDLDVKVNSFRFMTIASTLWFTLNKSWTPQHKWWSSYVKKLGMEDETYKLYEIAYEYPIVENMTNLYNHLKELIKDAGYDFNLTHEFISTITPKGRSNFIEHSYF